ncbi:MAG: GTPase ObgE [Microcystis sp. M015S2]|jgi:GTP-binding protein|uniref:GTPase Obg n=3 Tax=Microcystis TaxID=1125 RepID=I4IMS8_MICAE|nr:MULTISPECIES: GTPase ObgE [Microcystis]MCA2815721.1 GTPase ObgE [Microcystis sp. M085S1]MCA2854849.1 GTPase ObgE [Microcystis sp. M065S1]MCZ8308372.1 GTPase ObgE [Microcystis sp. LE19-98.1E]TRT96669.1 MAG: GTPase ObgE [Microcystis flos-aquae Ma_QC_C_20070823_S18D]TRV10589.1 MAG: GTPase ObgE [Microcystis flos-aquae Mf_QC_C_20070823_S10D]TRV20280.1 MAG: GTPase ObgE [Microcystis flos-aquae Mf_QC_C_20070823_S10]TRV31970.1 MAG: GTPase ObgE [Microcystis flos-aquae Mf_QC_C_20070823_S20]TRV34600
MQFIDRAEIEVEGGKGGDGIVAFRREKYVPAGGPAGGNGGKGGSVIFVATQNLQTLLDFQYSRYFKADDGKRGGPNNCTGANGSDRIIKVPCGTVVYDLDSEEIIGDLVTPEQTLIVAAGGKGGLGNRHFLSNNNRAPEYALPGLDGEKRHLRLELKLLAEVGIIGLPNAGKSTLISAVSSARPKIADYPFTTLIPNLGVVRKPTGDGTVFADIPGLIEGAHLGIGLGHEFLRHIERTRLLIHLVSLTSEDPIADYQIIQGELAAYGRELEKRSQILVFNKIDAVDEETIDNYQKQFAKITNAEILTISAVTGAGLTTLLAKVWQQLEQLERVEVETPSLFS